VEQELPPHKLRDPYRAMHGTETDTLRTLALRKAHDDHSLRKY
jgi:hypothetical protein